MIRVLAPLPVLLPLLGAALTLVLGRFARLQRGVSLAVLSAVVLDSVALLVQADLAGADAVAIGGWPAPQAIVLVIDRLSGLMLVVASAVALAVLVFAVGQGAADSTERTPVSIFHPTFLVLVAGVSLSFLSGDLFNLYVGFEVLLTASYVLITVGGSASRIRGGITYIVVSLLGSLVFLAAIGVVYAATGTVNLAQLSGRLADLPVGTQLLLHAMLLIGFGIKAAVFPLSTWLPDSYPTAPAPVTAVFAGLLTKVGIYAIIRTETLLFPGGGLDTVLLLAALVTMVVGILGAVAQSDIRRLLSFTLVSHIGYMVFGIALSTTAGLAGAIFYIVHHITVQTTLFLVAGLIERQGGATSVNRLGGLAAASPVLAVLFFLPAMNLAGIPPLSGFLGKLSLLEAGVADGRPLAYVLVVAGVVTSLLTLVAMSRVWSRTFWRPITQEPGVDSVDAAAADARTRRDGARTHRDGARFGDAVPEVRAGADHGPGGTAGADPPHGGPSAAGPPRATARRAVRQAAWRRHVVVAIGGDVAADGNTPVQTGAGTGEDGSTLPSAEDEVVALPRILVGTTAALVAGTVALTVLAGPLFGLADRAAGDLLDRGPYLQSVSEVGGR